MGKRRASKKFYLNEKRYANDEASSIPLFFLFGQDYTTHAEHFHLDQSGFVSSFETQCQSSLHLQLPPGSHFSSFAAPSSSQTSFLLRTIPGINFSSAADDARENNSKVKVTTNRSPFTITFGPLSISL